MNIKHNLDWLIENHIKVSPETLFLTLVEVKEYLETLQAAIDNYCANESLDTERRKKQLHIQTLFALKSESTIDPRNIPVYSRNDLDKELKRICKLSY